MKKIKNYIQFIKENTMFQYNDMIDYTLLEESATDQDIIELCEKANMFGVKSVCVLPKHVSLATKQLENSKVLVCTVISFPEGTNTIKQKISETNQVISNGADEVDMVLNYHELQGKDHLYEVDYLVEEVSTLVDICHSSKNKNGEPIILKVIVESGVLTDDEIIKCCDIYGIAGIDYLKTSTGYAEKGASVEAVKLFRKYLPENVQIKASGGIRDYATTKLMIEAGATRIGCSAGVAIVTGAQIDQSKSNY